jgi:hypothetical protein
LPCRPSSIPGFAAGLATSSAGAPSRRPRCAGGSSGGHSS